MLNRVTLRLGLTVGIAALLLGLLMFRGGVSPADVLAALRRLPPGVYLLALGLHVVTYLLRALRFRMLVPRHIRPGFGRTLVISSAHNLASYVLPAKTGEASFVVYLRLQAGVPASAGLASLLVSRFLDGAMLSLGLSIACWWLKRSGRYPALAWLGPLSTLLVASALLFLVLSMRGHLIVTGIESMLRWIQLHRWRVGERLLERTNGLALSLRAAGGGRRLPASAVLSLGIWTSVFTFFAVLARAMGMGSTLSFAEACFGATMGMLFNILPVNAAAGIGTQELGWVAGFHQFLGHDYDTVLSTGIGVHLVQLWNVVFLGLLAHVAMGAMTRAPKDVS